MLALMSPAPIAKGFRAVFRGPGLVLAEIAWRWCFGLTAWVLVVLTFGEWLAGISFTSGDWAMLRTRQPLLVAEAVAHTLQGTGARFMKTSIILALALVIFWIFAASVGRAATLKALLSRQKNGFGSLLGLHLFRSALALAASVGFFGVIILTSRVAPIEMTDSAALMARVLVFLLLLVVVGFLWGAVNWFLSLAPIFVLRDGRDTFGAIADSWDFFRRRSSALLGITFVFDLLRGVLLVTAALLAANPLADVHTSSELLAALWLVLGLSLIYFAITDFLYIARLAVYVSLVEPDLEFEAQRSPQPPMPVTEPVGPQ